MKTLRKAANQRAWLFSIVRIKVRVGYMRPGLADVVATNAAKDFGWLVGCIGLIGTGS